MSKEKLVARIETGFTSKAEAERAVEAVFGAVRDSLRENEPVEIRGFGAFRTKQRAGRVGRNPRTGEPIDITAKVVPTFKPHFTL